jgi:hypothetical protein
MKSKIAVPDLMRRLLMLSRSEADADSPQNPVKTRESRALAIRKRLVKALSASPSPK